MEELDGSTVSPDAHGVPVQTKLICGERRNRTIGSDIQMSLLCSCIEKVTVGD